MRDILPSPQEMIAHMDLYVEGQNVAKRVLAKAVYFHYLNIALTEQGKPKVSNEHSLVIGPTGSGKTLLLKTLGAYLGVPVLFCNAASLSAEGYVGESVGDLLNRLQAFCGGDSFKISRSILFLDEVDKLAIQEHATIRSEMVQQELLAVLDGNKIGRIEKSSSKSLAFEVDTSKLLIVASGAFAGIEKITESRLGKSAIGFKSEQKNGALEPNAVFTHVNSDDLVKYGFLPEFIGRFPNIVPLNKLDADQYLSILNSPFQSPFSNAEEIFGLHGVKLTISRDARDALATRAAEASEGARGLRRMAADVVKTVDWRLGELRTAGCIEIVVRAGPEGTPFETDFVYGSGTGCDEAERLRRLVFKKPVEAEVVIPKDHVTESGAEPVQHTSPPLPNGISNTRGWTDEQLTTYLEQLKTHHLDWDNTSGSARKWWVAFENENPTRKNLVVRLAEELKLRNASIVEFFLAYVYSNSDNIQANLAFLDLTRVKNKLREENRQVLTAPESESKLSESSSTELHAAVRYDESSPWGRFLFDCIEGSLTGMPHVVAHFSEKLTGRKDCTLDMLFSVAVLSQLHDPTGLFLYLDYVSLRIKELEVKKGLTWARDFYLRSSLDNDVSEVAHSTPAVHEWLFECARNAFVLSAIQRNPAIAEKYKDEFVEALQISEKSRRAKMEDSSLDDLIKELIAAVEVYPGSIGEWRAEFREHVARLILPRLLRECLEKRDEELLRSTLARLAKSSEMRTEESVWASTISSVIKTHEGQIDLSSTQTPSQLIQFLNAVYPAIGQTV